MAKRTRGKSTEDGGGKRAGIRQSQRGEKKRTTGPWGCSRAQMDCRARALRHSWAEAEDSSQAQGRYNQAQMTPPTAKRVLEGVSEFSVKALGAEVTRESWPDRPGHRTACLVLRPHWEMLWDCQEVQTSVTIMTISWDAEHAGKCSQF